MMKGKQKSNSFSSQAKLAQHKQRRDRRNLIYRLHLLLTFVGSLILTHQILANTDIFLLALIFTSEMRPPVCLN